MTAVNAVRLGPGRWLGTLSSGRQVLISAPGGCAVADQLRPVRTCLIGQPSEVANVLRSAQQRGHLVEYGTPRPMSGYRVAVDVTLMQPAKAAPTPTDHAAR
ncbi:hypothetical protein NKG94_52120 [Micromonospora sp. M12]